ncbi:Kinesin-like protein KIF16B [Dissostichus eleginoides]|uniref:Kinesin-like protein KIF16B n=1 Tax=Dissostichus eleginoides TaxID=100907 RepID=A0AAD9BLL5_DISEL|nr:Kinesin-like protein KIF16B [Dissostichus eleginoides]
MQSLTTLLPLSDDRINAYIEEEVQRRLRKMNLLNSSSSMDLSLSLSCESLREEEEASDCSSVRLTEEDEEKQNNTNPRKLKYEKACEFGSSLLPSPELEAYSPPQNQKNLLEEPENDLLKLHREEKVESAGDLIKKEEVPYKYVHYDKWWQDGVTVPHEEVAQDVCKPDNCDIGQRKLFDTSANTENNGFDENKNIPDKEEALLPAVNPMMIKRLKIQPASTKQG